ncbi:MAG: hypothetical protein QM786_13070 [Breznakibacter sp.]
MIEETEKETIQTRMIELFDKKAYAAVTQVYNENKHLIEFDLDVIAYVVECYMQLSNIHQASLLVDQALHNLKKREDEGTLNTDDEDDFDCFLNYKLEILYEQNLHFYTLYFFYKYKHRIKDLNSVREYMDSSKIAIRKKLFLGTTSIAISYWTLYHIFLKSVIPYSMGITIEVSIFVWGILYLVALKTVLNHKK